MTTPEEAVEQARVSVAAMREQGAYPPSESHLAPLKADRVTYGRLLQWAVVDPDPRNVRSTRRFGAPITAIKRALLRLLFQYHAELIAEQTRLNINLVHYVGALEGRVTELEKRLEEPGP